MVGGVGADEFDCFFAAQFEFAGEDEAAVVVFAADGCGFFVHGVWMWG